MKQLLSKLLFASLIGLVGCATTLPVQKPPEVVLKQFQAVWDELNSDVLDELPQEKVSFGKLVSKGKNVILGNSKRTLQEHANILQPFEKLAHPNGICFKGVWEITEKNRYNGYFKKDSKALIIARASTALSNTKQGGLRAFGFAGKLFPTMDPTEVVSENTANFFLIDDLGGTNADHYTDVALSNEPDTSITSVVLKSLLYVLKVSRTFAKVDENPNIRQLYEVSQLGVSNKEAAITPRWMKIAAQPGQTVDAKDFRDELKINENEQLVFSVFVGSEIVNESKVWQLVGTITLDTSIVSASCDRRLHFHHPVWDKNLNH